MNLELIIIEDPSSILQKTYPQYEPLKSGLKLTAFKGLSKTTSSMPHAAHNQITKAYLQFLLYALVIFGSLKGLFCMKWKMKLQIYSGLINQIISRNVK